MRQIVIIARLASMKEDLTTVVKTTYVFRVIGEPMQTLVVEHRVNIVLTVQNPPLAQQV